MGFDLLTIGGGFSGLVTACRAAELGMKAAVLERRTEERYPCSSRWSTGVFGVMQISLMNTPEVLLDAFVAGTGGTCDTALAEAVARNARRAKDWLEAAGARFEVRGELGQSQHVLAPVRRFDVSGLDWDGRGADRLMRRLEDALVARGGEVMRGTDVEALIVEGGACVGVMAARNGARVRIDAANVVIADGGFAANREMIRRHIVPHADRVLARVGPEAKGDGIRMAEAAGAAIGGFGAFYGHVHHRDAMTNAALWPYPHFDALAVASLVVGPDGRRFADEALGGVYLANCIARLADPLSAVIVFDDAMWTGGPGRAGPVPCNPTLLDGGGSLVSAPDLETLARVAGLPAAALAETVAAHNAAARGPTLPLVRPPYHAAPLCAGITGTMGGVVIDTHAQARRPDGTAFPGLYAVGTPVAGLEGGPHAGYAGGLCKGFVLGLLAAEHMAASPRHEGQRP
jgi:fumarate reductase flavoprotein subunit